MAYWSCNFFNQILVIIKNRKVMNDKNKVVARTDQGGKMEPNTISNGRSSKSHTSRGNFLNYLIVALLVVSAAFT